MLTRFTVAAILACAGALGCEGTHHQGPKAGGKSNWLDECVRDDDCSDDLTCVCNLCHAICTTDDECNQVGEATCTGDPSAVGECDETDAPMVCADDCEGDLCERADEAVSTEPWPPRTPLAESCDCGADQACGTSGCEPACDDAGHCALWRTGGDLVSLRVSASHVLWITDAERDPAGNPIGSRRLWIARSGGGPPAVLLRDAGDDVLDSVDGDHAILVSPTAGYRSVELVTGASPGSYVKIDGLLSGSVTNGVLYGIVPGGDDLTHIWSAPLDGSTPPAELVAVTTPGGGPFVEAFSHAATTASHLVLGWPGEVFATLAWSDLEAAPMWLGSGDSVWTFESQIFLNSDRRSGALWELASGEERRLFAVDAPVGVTDPRLHGGWLYYQAIDADDSGEFLGDRAGIWRVPTHAYGAPQAVIPAVATGGADQETWDLQYGLNDDGVFWHMSDAPGYILHKPLSPPACSADDVCGPDGTCVDGGCIPAATQSSSE